MPVSSFHTRAVSAALASAALASPLHAQAAASPFTTGYRYDVAGRQTAILLPDPDGSGPLRFAATRNTYNALGNLIKVEKGELLNWQAETVDPANWAGFTIRETTDLTYDDDGNPIKKVVSASGVVQSVEDRSFDAFNRPICTAIRMSSAVWLSQADACVSQTTDPDKDRITKTTYNPSGQLLKIQRSFGTTLVEEYAIYTYNNSDTLLNFSDPDSLTDAKGNVTRFEYGGSAYGKRTKWTFPSKTTPGSVDPSDYEQYTFDANGNPKTVRKRDGRTITLNYDGLGRLISKIVPDGCAPIQVGGCTPSAATRDVYYAYDLAGHQTRARYDSQTGSDGVVNTFDGFGALRSSTTSMGGVSRQLLSSYDDNGNRTTLTHPDGVNFTSDFDGLDRMRGSTWTAGGPPFSFIAIGYNSAGKRSSLSLGGAGAASSMGYGYDGLSRMTSFNRHFSGGVGDANLTYAYNKASQIETKTNDNDSYAWTGAVTLDRSYSTNGLNQYLAAGAITFTFDSNGNLLTDGTWTYVYDVENRLVSAVKTGISANLTYDPLGRLVQVAGSGIGDVQFLYDGDELVAEYGASGNMTRRFAFGPDEDEPVLAVTGAQMDCSSTTRFLHADDQGSIVALADCSGNRTNINTYDEYGITGAGNTGRFGYTGQVWLYEIGLFYYKARIYSPTLGRFLQVDPIGYDDQINLYAYVGNDPVNNTDPDGKQLMEKNAKDREIVRGVNAFIKDGKPQKIQLDKKTSIALSRDGNKVNFVIRQRVGVITGKISGTGTLSSSRGKVSLNGIRAKSETFGVTLTKAPSQLTLQNQPNGRIAIHTSGPFTAKVLGQEKGIPEMHQLVNP